VANSYKTVDFTLCMCVLRKECYSTVYWNWDVSHKLAVLGATYTVVADLKYQRILFIYSYFILFDVFVCMARQIGYLVPPFHPVFSLLRPYTVGLIDFSGCFLVVWMQRWYQIWPYVRKQYGPFPGSAHFRVCWCARHCLVILSHMFTVVTCFACVLCKQHS
jgi:hypothetical protein